MADPRFYAPDLAGPVIRLDDREARHARQSRRLTAGVPVTLFDGAGGQAAGQIEVAGKSQVTVRIGQVSRCPRSQPQLTVAVAVPKGARQDVLIEKCTELGVAAIQPIVTARSVCSASEHRLDKWRQTTIEAAKQSGQCWLPSLAPLRPLGQVLTETSGFDLLLAAVPGGRSAKEWLPDLENAHRLLAVVGPEGGWTEAESEALIAAGCRSVSLGSSILRIETAAVAIAAMVHALAYSTPSP